MQEDDALLHSEAAFLKLTPTAVEKLVAARGGDTTTVFRAYDSDVESEGEACDGGERQTPVRYSRYPQAIAALVNFGSARFVVVVETSVQCAMCSVRWAVCDVQCAVSNLGVIRVLMC